MSRRHPVRTIAIDGPAGAGKSTLGLGLARRLGFLYLDTGVTYRAVALAALRRGIAPEDEAAVSELAERVHIEVSLPHQEDGRPYSVWLDGEDVTWSLRDPGVEIAVSIVAAFSRVRRAMVARQRRIAGDQQAVVVGRDVGTTVIPDADLKIYLDASLEARAARRHLELTQRGVPSRYDDVLEGLRRRDQLDRSRADSPLRPASDAIVLDSTELSAEQTLARALALVQAHNAAPAPVQPAP